MAAPEPPPANPRRPHTRAGHIVRWFAWGCGVLGLVVAGLAWWTTRPDTVRWLAQTIAQHSGGQLALDGVDGSLWHGIAVRSVRFDRETLHVSIDDLRMRWWWWPPETLVVSTFEARRVEVRSVSDPTATPPTRPASLRLPIALRVPRLAIDTLLIDRGDDVQRVEHLIIDLALDRDAWRVQIDDARSHDVTVRGEVHLATAAPFELHSHWRATPNTPRPFDVIAVAAEGPLDAVRVGLAAHVHDDGGMVIARAQVRPWADTPVDRIALQGQGIRLSALTAVDGIDALLDAQGTLSVAHGVLSGPVQIVNRRPAPLDAGGVPIERAQARLTLDRAVQIDALVAQIAGGGTLSGHVIVDAERTQAHIDLQSVRSDAVHTALVPWRLSGHVQAQIETSGGVDARVSLAAAGLALDAAVRTRDRTIVVDAATLRADRGTLSVTGRWARSGAQPWTLDARATRFDLTRVLRNLPKGEAPAAASIETSLDARLTANGTLAGATRRAHAALQIERWAIAGAIVAGRATVSAQWGRGGVLVDDADVDLHAAQSRLVVRGGWGLPDRSLEVHVAAPQADAWSTWIGMPVVGSARLDARVAGTLAAPEVSSTVSMRGVRVGAEAPLARIDALDGRLAFVAGHIDASARTDGVSIARTPFATVSWSAQGTLADHTMIVEARGDAALRDAQARLDVVGGLTLAGRDGPRWRGEVRRLVNEGRFPLRLQAPAPLELAARAQRFGPAVLDVADGRVDIDTLVHEGAALRSKGRVHDIPVQAVSRWFDALRSPRNTLVLGGEWDVTIGERFDAHVAIGRERGDVALSNSAAGQLGIDQLAVALDVRDGALEASLQGNSARAGHLDATLRTQLTRRDGRWGVLAGAPLAAHARGALTSLAWLGLVVDAPVAADGRVTFDIDRTGTVGQPVLRGALVAEGLSLRWFEPRAALHDGQVRITWVDDRITVQQCTFQGRSGTLHGEGEVTLAAAGPNGRIDVTLDRLDAVTDPSLRAVASGRIGVSFARGAADVDGRLHIDEARWTLTDLSSPTLGSDVVVVPPSGQTADATPAPGHVPVNAQISIDLGERFHVVGYGADAVLGGAMDFKARAGQALRAIGTVQTLRGTYAAYGQRLNVTRGVVTFNGPLDDPGLSIRAERPNLPVQVGVEVSGSLKRPNITLVSTPEMTSTEKLSWLALGHGLDAASRNDLQTLSLAASALLQPGDGPPAMTQIARGLGLDDLSLRGSTSSSGATGRSSGAAPTTASTDAESTVVSVGKRLSDRLYLTFERSLSGASTLATLRYEVAQRWYVQTQTGTDSALDVFYTLRFD